MAKETINGMSANPTIIKGNPIILPYFRELECVPFCFLFLFLILISK